MIGRLKEDNPELIANHCIIHQSVLCSTRSDDHAEVMNTIMKMIIFLMASSSCQHRMLWEFLRDVEASADDLLRHNNVRRLSKGRVLEWFWSVRKEVTAFSIEMKSQKATPFSLFLKDEKNMNIVAFLVEVNVKLQGQNNSICELITAVRAFQRKLEVFSEDLQGECRTRFRHREMCPLLLVNLLLTSANILTASALDSSSPSSSRTQMSGGSQRKSHSSSSEQMLHLFKWS